ncbi:MAG: hypothetical protein E4H13_14420, partial [Calditrichales bacterium]
MKPLIYLALFLLLAGDEPHIPSTFVFPSYLHTYGIRKAGATELFLFMGFRVKFSNPQGIACVRLDAWEDPEDPHDDDELTVYGVNSGQNNIIFNKSMWAIGVYGLDEDDTQLLDRPRGICANNAGDVYVADTGHNRVARLFNPGHELVFVSAIGEYGSENGQFISPQQVAIDNSGTLFVSDSGNHRIQVFDSTGNYQFAFSGEGFLIGPTGLAVTDEKEKHAQVREDFIIVIDSLRSRISKFAANGQRLQSISAAQQLGLDSLRLEYVCIDYHNHILITDSKNHCIHKFNSRLEPIISFGEKGDDDYQFLYPRGITIYRRLGQLFVAEENGAQYYWVGTDIFDLKAIPDGETTRFSFRVTEPSYITAEILDDQDRFVADLIHRRYLGNAGNHVLQWRR